MPITHLCFALLFNGERKIRGSESSLSFSLRGTKVPRSESLRERKFPVFSLLGANVPYWELSLPGAKVPKNEKAHFCQLYALFMVCSWSRD